MRKSKTLILAISTVGILLSRVGYANEEKECKGEMGDVKMSLLGLSEFTELHGNCWKALDGTDIEGEPLAQMLPHLEGKTPNALGQFFRVMDPTATVDPDGETRSVGSLQQQQVEAHQHKIRVSLQEADFGKYKWGNPKEAEHRYKYSEWKRQYWTGFSNDGKTKENEGQETRPKNIAIHAYVNVGNPDK